MDVKQRGERFSVSGVLTSLLQEFGAVSDHRTLRDNLPGCLLQWLACRGVLIYLATDETLQLVSGTFDDGPGWSPALLAAAHINPIALKSQAPEARAWREKHAVGVPATEPTLMAVPLINRRHCIGVLVAVRGTSAERPELPACWSFSEIEPLETIAGVVALLLENTRLRDRDRVRIHELSLLNSISSQLHSSLYEKERLYSIVVQRTKEICAVDLCELLEPLPAEPDDYQVFTSGDEQRWVTPALHHFLFRWSREQQSLAPLIVEQPGAGGDARSAACLELLPTRVKTFFAIPLLRGRAPAAPTGAFPHVEEPEPARPATVSGIIVGGYYHARKLRSAELTLLQVLASQVSTVLENMRLMAEVIEARNETRDLLRQVLEDRRLKELILESIPSGLITTDLQGRIHTFNRAAATILGYHPYEVLGQSLRKFLNIALPWESTAGPGVGGRLQGQSGGSAETDPPQLARVAVKDRFERERVLEVDARRLCDEQGASVGMLVTFSDMTSMQRLEEEKQRLDRLAALGEMAAGVAHEVRNPLASIKTSIQMLRDELRGCEPGGLDSDWAQEAISVVLKEVERLDSIVRDLLLFARPRQLHRVCCNLAEVCDQVLALLQKQCADANIIVHRVYEHLPPAWLDMGQIEQVLLNLLTNAIQAMPEGGIITVTCRAVTDGCSIPASPVHDGSISHESAVTSIASPRQWLELIVADTGTGIAPMQHERIFQPFHTTKAHGIGLGLPITRRLVEDHGGSIRIESQLGYGATVIVRLPVVNENEEHRQDWNEAAHSIS